MTIRVVIVDDQLLVRIGFAAILGSEDDIDVVGEASNGAEALDVCRAVRPDVVVMDIRMPIMDGVEATRRLLAEHSAHDAHNARDAHDAHGQPFVESLRVLILTTFDVDELVHAAIRAGASGFLLKDAPPEDLLRAVRVIAAGDAMIAPSVTRRMLAHFAEQRSASTSFEAQRAIEHLTDRERDVLKLIAPRPVEPRDRRHNVCRRDHSEDACRSHLHEAQRPRPSAGCGNGLRRRFRRSGQLSERDHRYTY